MKLKRFLIILFTGITSCVSSESEEAFVVQNGDTLRISKEYDFEGRLKTERTIDKDSLTQGIAKMFYEDGTLHAELNFKDNKKEGLEKSYYRSGKIKHIGLNSSGKQDSMWIWYYESGVLEETANWINGASHGENISYYTNGMIKMFRFYFFGDLIYVREYDSSGNVIKEEGRIPIGIAYNKNNLKVGELFNMVILAGLLPQWNAILEIRDGEGKIIKKINDKSGFEKVLWGNRVVIKEITSSEGAYKWLINITLIDERGKKMRYSETFTRTVSKRE